MSKYYLRNIIDIKTCTIHVFQVKLSLMLFLLQIILLLGFAEAQCNNEDTATAEGCKDLLNEEEFATDGKKIYFTIL